MGGPVRDISANLGRNSNLSDSRDDLVYHFSFYSMTTTGIAHPLAGEVEAYRPTAVEVRVPDLPTIQICYDHIGVLWTDFVGNKYDLLIFNWKTGERELVRILCVVSEKHILT